MKAIYWLKAGQFVDCPQVAIDQKKSDKNLLAQFDLVKFEISSAGTCVTWYMFSANWTSLEMIKEMLKTCPGPFELNYFNSGWFDEVWPESLDARNRIDQLMGKSDVRLSARVYRHVSDPRVTPMPDIIKDIWNYGPSDEKRAVHCGVNILTQSTQVEHVGSETPLAKVWGISPVSYPCVTGHSYDRIVSQGYIESLTNNKPVYDQICAAMVDPRGEVRWYSYHRLIYPHKKLSDGAGEVKVFCQRAPVDISLL